MWQNEASGIHECNVMTACFLVYGLNMEDKKDVHTLHYVSTCIGYQINQGFQTSPLGIEHIIR